MTDANDPRITGAGGSDVLTRIPEVLDDLEHVQKLLSEVRPWLMEIHERLLRGDERHNAGRIEQARKYLDVTADFANPDSLLYATHT